MSEHEPEKIIGLPVNSETAAVCPFTEPQGKRIGDILLSLIFFIPLTLLIYFAILLM